MIFYKTEDEVQLMRESADVLGRAHAEVTKLIKPGVTTKKLDKVAEEFIRDLDGIPSFLNYNGFPYSLCISVNDQVVHGMPSESELVDGDIISVDCGVLLNEFHSDSAYTYAVGEVGEEVSLLLQRTKESLYKGIEMAVSGNRIGDVGNAIQEYTESFGYGVVRELVGHGIGKDLHEKPEVPNYGRKGKGIKLQTGMALAIEPMINMGVKEVVQEDDGWTIRTKDNKPSAHFEHTVIVRKNEAEVVTTFKYIEEVLNG